MLVLALAAGALFGAQPDVSQGKRVLVIVNSSDPESIRLGRYYSEKRGVPRENMVVLETTPSDEVRRAQFEKEIEAPVKAALAKAKTPIDYLLLIRGVPLRIREGGYSVDSLLMSADVKTQPLPVGKDTFEIADNPYFGKTEPFSHAKFGFYLACRLDGYTFEDVRNLVDHSLAAKRSKGPFLLDQTPGKRVQSYGELQSLMDKATDLLKAKGFSTIFDKELTFVGSPEPVAGYVSWGSNDNRYDVNVYHSLRFQPGAIAETFVSTSGRAFHPVTSGQSLIADLIAQGVTGVKGYVSEPYLIAMAKPDLLFGRYTSGANLADSFYSASPAVHWKDIVIGDPLCAPYK